MSVLVTSTHLDDAILSCGQFLAGRNDCTVLTVFTGIPNKDVLTEYDKDTGFKSSKEAMEARRWEDGEATALLGAEKIYLDFYDSQYNIPNKGLKGALEQAIKNYDMVLAPLGLRHPDHELVSDTILSMRDRIKKLYLYEDLPHRVTHPELVFARLQMFPNAKLEFIGDGALEEKLRALICYRSQMRRGDLNIHNICVSERFWKV